ncbi:MAG: hypothetical protein LUG98_03870 [Tannerellaceae bacterium]|nr:hypothetical protein [Tannerellaceae bacterium]
MRTIEEIKEGITNDFMNNEFVSKKFGFTVGDDYNKHFSKVSLINILFYIFASAAWIVEKMFETHKQEVNNMLESILPHRARWYCDKVLHFMKDRLLVEETDQYDTTGMTSEEIEAARVIKHAVATESADQSGLLIKVAEESGGVRGPLDKDTEEQLVAYLRQIKDAGVRIILTNAEPDLFDCKAEIYYNPILTGASVEEACQAAIKNYVENLPFNGEYSHMGLVDVLQQVEGVKIAEITAANITPAGSAQVISPQVRYVPEAGYFKVGDEGVQLNMYPHE